MEVTSAELLVVATRKDIRIAELEEALVVAYARIRELEPTEETPTEE